MSWYFLFFQFEGIAEQWLSADDFANMREWAQHPDMDQVAIDLAASGAFTAALNWYRANVHPRTLDRAGVGLPAGESTDDGRVELRRLRVGRSRHDRFGPVRRGPVALRTRRGPGHWMQLDAPDEVTRLLLDFLPKPG